MKSEFDRLLKLEEKIFDGSISSIELKEYNNLYNSIFERASDRTSSNESDNLLNDFYDSTLHEIKQGLKDTGKSLKDKWLPAAKRKASDLYDEAKSALSEVKPLIHDELDEVRDTISEIKPIISDGVQEAKDIAGDLFGKLKQKVNVPNVPLAQRNCNHEIFYLISDVPSYNYESNLLKYLNHRCICKCLKCGKEITLFNNNLGCNVIVEDDNIRGEDRFNLARKYYVSLKLQGYSGIELMDNLYTLLEKDKSKGNSPKLRL